MQLDDIRVVDLSRLLPGPYGTQLLADMGAEVIKVEPPKGGDYARHIEPKFKDIGGLFKSINRGKKSITLNLKSEKGQEIFLSLIEDADVIFEQYRPGVVESLGIDYQTVNEKNSDIVYCSLTGFGQTGPYKDRAGHDLNYVGLSGMLDMTRQNEDEAPRLPGFQVADMAGGLFAVLSIVSALLNRELGGAGTYIDASMIDVMMSFSQTLTPMVFDDKDPRPGQTPLTGQDPCYDVYETADGKYVALAAIELKFWRTFCEAVDREDLIQYHGVEDSDDIEYVRAELEDLFRSKARDEWEAELGKKDAMVTPIKSPGEAVEDPHIVARELVLGNSPPRIEFPASVDGLTSETAEPPALGEHTEQILEQLGYDNYESLQANGVI